MEMHAILKNHLKMCHLESLAYPATIESDDAAESFSCSLESVRAVTEVLSCLENNNTLQASLARLDQAIAQSQARGAALLPTVSVTGTGSRTLTSANRPTSTYDSVNVSTVQNDFRPVALMTYEIDWLG
jgi:outer membrane protein TolC